jgi:hypothetical protein
MDLKGLRREIFEALFLDGNQWFSPFGLLQQSDPQPAVDNRSKPGPMQAQDLSSGCLKQSCSGLQQSKGSLTF